MTPPSKSALSYGIVSRQMLPERALWRAVLFRALYDYVGFHVGTVDGDRKSIQCSRCSLVTFRKSRAWVILLD